MLSRLRTFAKTPRTPKKLFVAGGAALGVFALTYLVVAGVSYVYVRHVLLPSVHPNPADLERRQDRIIADFKVLNEKPIYEPLARDKNAEHFLSGFISWEGDGLEPIITPDHERLTSLMQTYDRSLLTNEDWQRFVADPLLLKLDLTWVDQLEAYDHFDFGTHPSHLSLLGRVATSNGIGRAAIAASLPMPSFREIRFAAIARVAQIQSEIQNQNRKTGARSTLAPRLFRHVGYLLSTTDSLVGSAVAASMLGTEKTLASRTGLDWPLVTDTQILAMKRASWAWVGIEKSLSTEDGFGAYAAYMNRRTFACSGIYDSMPSMTILQDYLLPPSLFETNLAAEVAKANAFQTQYLNDCAHDELKVFLRPVPVAANPFWARAFRVNFARIPFLRQVVGLTQMSLASPNFFRLYDEAPRQPASNLDGSTEADQ